MSYLCCLLLYVVRHVHGNEFCEHVFTYTEYIGISFFQLLLTIAFTRDGVLLTSPSDSRCRETCQARPNMRCQGSTAECSTLKPSSVVLVKACQGKRWCLSTGENAVYWHLCLPKAGHDRNATTLRLGFTFFIAFRLHFLSRLYSGVIFFLLCFCIFVLLESQESCGVGGWPACFISYRLTHPPPEWLSKAWLRLSIGWQGSSG